MPQKAASGRSGAFRAAQAPLAQSEDLKTLWKGYKRGQQATAAEVSRAATAFAASHPLQSALNELRRFVAR